jgi:hypothetical protein
MKRMRHAHKFVVALAIVLTLPPALSGQKQDKEKSDKPGGMSKLRIEVTAGEKNVPVDNASVYVRFNIGNSKKLTEMNLKTNRDGVAHSPEIPARKVLVQVLAEGWKTYGRWFDTEPGEQTIKVHLEKPPKWY